MDRSPVGDSPRRWAMAPAGAVWYNGALAGGGVGALNRSSDRLFHVPRSAAVRPPPSSTTSAPSPRGCGSTRSPGSAPARCRRCSPTSGRCSTLPSPRRGTFLSFDNACPSAGAPHERDPGPLDLVGGQGGELRGRHPDVQLLRRRHHHADPGSGDGGPVRGADGPHRAGRSRSSTPAAGRISTRPRPCSTSTRWSAASRPGAGSTARRSG